MTFPARLTHRSNGIADWLSSGIPSAPRARAGHLRRGGRNGTGGGVLRSLRRYRKRHRQRLGVAAHRTDEGLAGDAAIVGAQNSTLRGHVDLFGFAQTRRAGVCWPDRQVTRQLRRTEDVADAWSVSYTHLRAHETDSY